MAYTVLATWDFRGADSAATKRDSRRGSYTLTESGSVSWSADGADCSGGNGIRLTLALPAELKNSPAWWVGSLQVMNATAPPEFTNVLGLQQTNATNALYNGTLMLCRKPDNTSLRARFTTEGGLTFDAGVVLGTGTDHVIAARRTDTNNPALGLRINNDAWDTDGITSDTLTYSETAQLVFGSPTDGVNSHCRYHWFVMGSGGITDAEVQDIYDDPAAFIYDTPPSGPSAAALAFFLSR